MSKSAPTSGNGTSNGSIAAADLQRKLAQTAVKTNPDNPYIPSVKMHNDVAAVLLRENGRLWFGIKALAVICIAAFGLAYLNSIKPPYIGAMVIDKSSNTVSVSSLPMIQAPAARQAIVNYFLPIVIESAFTVGDISENKRDILQFVRPYVAVPSQASDVFAQYLLKYDPNKRASSVRVRIVVDKIPPPSRDNEYVVGWTAFTTAVTDGSQISQQHYQAVVDLRWTTPFGADSQGNVGPNMSGMQITTFSVLSPSGSPAQADGAANQPPSQTQQNGSTLSGQTGTQP